MFYLKLAWRNIWRNRRRTLITTTAIFIAVALSVFMRSQQEGSYENMIATTVGSFLGHIQIHQAGYWEEQSLDNSFELDNAILKKIKDTKGIKAVIPRLQSYALLASEQKTRAGLVMGIDMTAEKMIANPQAKLVKGSYFEEENEASALIGEQLAKYLDLDIGDTLVAIGQGFQGMSAAGKYTIKGIFKLASPDLNKSLVCLPLEQAQELFAAYERVTALAFALDKPRSVLKIDQLLEEKLANPDLEVMSWQEMMPEMLQMIESDRVSGKLIIWVLYVLVGFGIFGTVLMMTAERKYEFGVLIGIGMKRLKIGFVVFLETLMLACLGIITGILAISPLIWYLYYNPIQMTGAVAKAIEDLGYEAVVKYSINSSILTEQALTVLLMTAIIALYPIWATKRLKVVEAMRN